MATLPDLSNTRTIVIVWAMDGCGACDEFLPLFLKRVEAARAVGAPLKVWRKGALQPGEIPILLLDAGSEDAELQALADRLQVSATPTTCVLTRHGATKVEGAIDPNDIDAVLFAAQKSNR